MAKAAFVRKAINLQELKDKLDSIEPSHDFVIDKVVELPETEYENFSNKLLDDFDFIKGNKELMYYDQNKVWHCILVKAVGAKDGICLESEGYDYARYAFYFMEEGFVTDKIMSQILEIRDEGNCNMVDSFGVQREAHTKNFHELVLFIENHRKDYVGFILTGQR